MKSLRAIQEQEDLRWLMSTAQGRRTVYRVLRDTRAFSGSYVEGSSEATAFNEGRRSYGLKLLDDITRLTFNDYLKMLAEHAPDTEGGG